MHAKGSDLIQGSFMQKALFGYETYTLVDIIQGSVRKTETTLGISSRKGFNRRNKMLIKRSWKADIANEVRRGNC